MSFIDDRLMEKHICRSCCKVLVPVSGCVHRRRRQLAINGKQILDMGNTLHHPRNILPRHIPAGGVIGYIVYRRWVGCGQKQCRDLCHVGRRYERRPWPLLVSGPFFYPGCLRDLGVPSRSAAIHRGFGFARQMDTSWKPK